MEPIYSAILSAVVSFICAYATLYITNKTDRENKEDKTLTRSPFLVISESKFEGGNIYKFSLEEQTHANMPYTFTLDRRGFTEIVNPQNTFQDFSLLIDTTPININTNSKISELIGYHTYKLKNIGHTMISFEILNIMVKYKNKKQKLLKPGTHSKLCVPLVNGEHISIKLSWKAVEDDYCPYNFNTMSAPEYKRRFNVVSDDNQAVNTFLIDDTDYLTDFEIVLSMTNIYNGKYFQKIHSYTVNNVNYIDCTHLSAKEAAQFGNRT